MKKTGHGRLFCSIASFALFFFYCFFLGVRYGDFFHEAQYSGLFLFDDEFFREHLLRPGGCARYLAAFCAQFFYYPAVGGVLFAILMDAIRRLGLRLFARDPRRPGVNAYAASLVPPAILTIGATWRGYSVFTPFEPTAPFVPTIGVLVAFAVAALWRRFAAAAPERFRLRAVVFAGLAALLYPFAGYWGLLGAALALLCERYAPLAESDASAPADAPAHAAPEPTDAARRQRPAERRMKSADRRARSAAKSAPQPAPAAPVKPAKPRRSDAERSRAALLKLEALAIFLFPMLWYWLAFYKRTSYSAIFWSGALEPCLDLKDVQVQLAAGVTLTLTTLFSLAAAWFGSRRRGVSARPVDMKARSRRVHLVSALVCLVPVVVWTASYGAPDFFVLCRCARLLADEKWEELLTAESRAPRPTGALVGARNAALYRLGLLGAQAFERPVDGERVTPPSGADEPTALSAELALSFGQANLATRSATYYLVQTDDRSARYVRTLALAALANGEFDLARKYSAILGKTLFYRADASKIADAANRPDEGTEYAARAGRLRALRPRKDGFVTGYPFYPFLADVCSDDWDAAKSPGLDARLVNLLIERRVAEFGARFLEAGKGRQFDDTGAVPKHYQEALLVWNQLGGASDPDDQRIVDSLVASNIRGSFREFNEWLTTVDLKTYEGRRALFDRYGSTYWGYYYDPLTSYAQQSREGGVR